MTDREKFEAWNSVHGRYRRTSDAYEIVDGRYWVDAVQSAWEAWQAACATPAPAQPESASMPQYWSVQVTADGEALVSIGNDWLSGERPLEQQDEQTIIGAAQHLLSFVGYGLPPLNFNPDDDEAAGAAAPAEGAAWQPIETAPKDGTEIWGYCICPSVVALKWTEQSQYYGRPGWEDGESNVEWRPTHWMPAVAAPTSPTPAQEGKPC